MSSGVPKRTKRLCVIVDKLRFSVRRGSFSFFGGLSSFSASLQSGVKL